MTEATTIRCNDLGELDSNVVALGQQGYRIVAVLDLGYNHHYTIVAQKDTFADYQKVMSDIGEVIMNAVHDAVHERMMTRR